MSYSQNGFAFKSTLSKKILLFFVLVIIIVSNVFASAGNKDNNFKVIIPKTGFGFSSPDITQFDSENLVAERKLIIAKKAGASWLRMLINWGDIEKNKGSYDWKNIDKVVKISKKYQINILGNIAFSPGWANNNSLYTAPPTRAHYADYKNFIRKVVSRYKSNINNWQIWNEPNLNLFWGGKVNTDEYINILKIAYNQIKNISPTSKIITAGMSRELGENSPENFYKKIYAKTNGKYFDGVAMHPYLTGCSGKPTLEKAPMNAWKSVLNVKDLMKQNRDSQKKIWFTEVGAPTNRIIIPGFNYLTCREIAKNKPRFLQGLNLEDLIFSGVTQEEQARQIKTIFEAINRLEYAGPTFIYTIQDSELNSTNQEGAFGALLTKDWKYKKTFYMLKNQTL